MDLPFRAEYAKSGRSSCKGCRTAIAKDTLRLAVMVQSPLFDGKTPNWYHVSCFFAKQRVKTVGDISHFESLRWEDQELIRSRVAGGPATSSSNGTASGEKGKKTTKRKAKSSLADFSIEYSISSRATCRGCEEKIVKQDIRASKKDYDSEEGRRYGGIPLWHHLECFSKVRQELEFWDSGAKLPGFKKLEKEDQERVKKVLPAIQPINVKKEESDDVDCTDAPKKPKIEGDNIVREQNKMMFQYRDNLKLLPKKDLVALLECNNQQIPVGTDRILDRLSDAMSFGVLLPCKECRHGQYVFRSGIGYFCLGNKDEWVKCETVTDDPKRKPFIIPEGLKKKYDFLASYKYKPQKRVFQAIQPSVSNDGVLSASYALKSMKSEPSTSGPKVIRDLPLKNIELATLGKLPLGKEDLKLKIMKLGGKLSSKVTSQTTAIIAQAEVLKGSSKFLKVAEEHGIQIVPFDFLEECEKPGANGILNINKMNLATWGSDPTNRMNFDVVDSKSSSRSTSFSAGKFKSNLSKVKLKVKDGVAVDPDSGLEDVAHVYRFNKDVYTAALSLTDLQTGRNSYYKLQILESTSKTTYWLFRAWGRIGTTIGGTKLDKKDSREDAIAEFEALFEEKTANMWRNRSNFRKVPGKMNWVDISYEDDSIDKSQMVAVPSKLPQPIQNLISLIFNVDTMKNVMLEFELDMEKMPLGKLSKKQMTKAFEVLSQLQNYISLSGDQSRDKKILSLTNQFYTLIPHDFGIENPPLLNDLDTIKQKDEMLNALMEIEIAYSMLRDAESENKDAHIIDSYYMKLKAEIDVLDKNAPEFKTLQLYVNNTHAETHRNYDLEIMEIYKVNRQGEDKRYKPFKKLHNRKLLWHGSRLTNFAGILSQGLRIAPPEAPVTGYMFGKGIYFADMVSKSANYCMTNYTNNTGMVLLCEVALGDMHELTQAQDIKKPPAGKHSVKGLGKTEPATHEAIVREDGVEIPLGKGVQTTRQTSLLYNEYIVYDVAQVKVEYLVQLKFHHK